MKIGARFGDYHPFKSLVFTIDQLKQNIKSLVLKIIFLFTILKIIIWKHATQLQLVAII